MSLPGQSSILEVRGDDPGFGVYIHWPFCAQKCPYCDFNSHVRHNGWDEDGFVAAYQRELRHVAQLTGSQTVSTIFFGGGTPSLMQASTVGALLDEVGALWPVADDVEVTLEANPGSVEAARFQGYRAAGVNRVSIGVQALNDRDLRALGRIHTVADARAAVALATSIFDRVSFDLIYARARQTVAAWRDELAEALRFSAGHLSLYQLTIEEGTPFAQLHAAGKLVVPDSDLSAQLFEATQELTTKAGLPAYETSNHAAPGQECRHNLVYWRYGSYAGIGPGAHGRLDVAGQRLASQAERQPEVWKALVDQRGHGMRDLVTVSQDEMADEMLLMGLRLREGVDLNRLRSLCGLILDRGMVRAMCAEGLIEVSADGRWLRAIGHGPFVLNEIVLQLSQSFLRSPDGAMEPV